MEKKTLLKSAENLHSIDVQFVDEYLAKTDLMVSQLNTTFTKRPDLEKLIGSNNLEMMKDNHANHARFMGVIMENYDASIFVETILWVFNAYKNHGFSSNYWAAQLNTWITITKEHVSENAFHQIEPFYQWMQVHIPEFDALSK